jgi:hypothetical protein
MLFLEASTWYEDTETCGRGGGDPDKTLFLENDYSIFQPASGETVYSDQI